MKDVEFMMSKISAKTEGIALTADDKERIHEALPRKMTLQPILLLRTVL